MADLTSTSDADLIAELRNRGLVASTWNVEDAKGPIEGDADAEDLSDEQLEQAAKLFLERTSEGLVDILADRGNGYLTDRWSGLAEEILAEVRSAPAP